jgi:YHS domain-containing protein
MLRVVLLLILLIIVARIFWRVIDSVFEGMGATRRQMPEIKLRRDPVCGKLVSPGQAVSLTKDGTTRYFCSEKCLHDFIAR